MSSTFVLFILHLILIICFTFISVSSIGPIIKINLNANSSNKIWMARGLNGTRVIEVPASVPGGIYSDLNLVDGIFNTRIYYRYNDKETKWVGRTNWNFSRNFHTTEKLLKKNKIILICEGLDTIANVYVNDILVGSSQNMFVRYIYNIKHFLKLGTNTLLFQFEAPVLYAEHEYNVQSQDYPVLPVCYPSEYQGECHANHIRKMQASFAWDWGPSYPSSGIWKNISIEGFDSGVIRDVMFFSKSNRTIPDETSNTLWECIVRLWYDEAYDFNRTSQNISAVVTLTLKSKVQTNNSTRPIIVHSVNISLQSKQEWKNHTDILFLVQGDKVKLWWPNGYGKQPLYDIELTYKNSAVPDELSIRTFSVGFRTIELIQEPIDSTDLKKGLSFYINVNGIPIYSKGSNFIPIHVLPEMATLKMTHWLFESSKIAHFNMIRVWGGGIYESDEFYQYADENGILIWQDFMFACAMYPTQPKYLQTVQQEINTQVKRLQHHTSIAIWSANNENEAALRGNWYGTSVNFSLYAQDYIKLYIHTILDNVQILDPSRSCLSSSPTNGKQSQAEGWIAHNPYSTLYGDVHFYNYTSDGWDWRSFPNARYTSEFGYQAWPSPETLITATVKDVDWTWNSTMMNHRQHHLMGQWEMEQQIKIHLPIPINSNSSQAFTSMLYLAQINQAMSLKTQTEFYRRLKGQLFKNGEGYNMGALYWQLNDIWPGASWASIENTGRWKMSHYYAKNFFAPIIISSYDTNNGDISVHLISDSLLAFNGTLRVRLFKLDSLTPLLDYTTTVEADPLQAHEVHVIKSTSIEECKNSINICLLYFSMVGVPDNFFYLEYPTQSSFIHDPNLKISSYNTTDSQTFIVSLKTQAIAPFVFLNIKTNDMYGYFSDNGFNMVNPITNVTYKSQIPMTLDEFQTQLQIISLYDVIV